MTLGYPDLLKAIKNDQIERPSGFELSPQPTSLDVPLTHEVYRMPCSILPRTNESIGQIVKERAIHKVAPHELLELGQYYLAKADLTLNFSEELSGSANNKSSSGRVNLQGRIMLDGVSLFDTIPKGYQGEVWVEIHPELCPVQNPTNLPPINQIRLREGHELITGENLRKYHDQTPLLCLPNGEMVPTKELQLGQDESSIHVGINLLNFNGWKGKRQAHTPILLEDKANPWQNFFEKLNLQEEKLIMERDEFYILGSYQRVRNPLDVCITMRPFQAHHGEFRTHYAGFFDPGNGFGKSGEETGFVVTMEVIPMESAIEIRHEQPMFAIEVEPLKTPCPPEFAYGKPQGSHYHSDPSPKLARWFK